MDFDEFSKRFLTGAEPIFDLLAPVIRPGDSDYPAPDPARPRVVVRHGQFVAVLEFQALAGHLSIDVHPFVGGQDARAGVFGMENGKRISLPDTGSTSHQWPAARMLTVLVGVQGDTAAEEQSVVEDLATPDLTSNGVPIAPGLHVFTNDWDWGVVGKTDWDKYNADSRPGGKLHDGWYNVELPGGGRKAIYNGERMSTRDPDGKGHSESVYKGGGAYVPK